MALYPDVVSSICAVYPLDETINFNTLINKFDKNNETRKAKSNFPTRDISIRYEAIDDSDIATLYQFYIARKGSYEAFNFFYPESTSYSSEYVGIGDGSTTEFNLPSKLATSYTVYIDSASTTAYTFSSRGGADGADKITFTTAPNDGSVITFSFTGYLKVHCRFNDDNMSYSNFSYQLFNTGLKLKGLLNE